MMEEVQGGGRLYARGNMTRLLIQFNNALPMLNVETIQIQLKTVSL